LTYLPLIKYYNIRDNTNGESLIVGDNFVELNLQDIIYEYEKEIINRECTV